MFKTLHSIYIVIPNYYSINVRRHSWKVLFFGSDDFSVYSLIELVKLRNKNSLLSCLDVSTTTSSSPNAVQKFSAKNNIRVYPWPPKGQSNYDFGIVVSFGHLIPKSLINTFPLGMINVHASLLPRWRGASPIVHAILSGDSETGISIMRIQPHHFDTGDIILQQSCRIAPRIDSKIAVINWKAFTALQIYNQYRALYGFHTLRTCWHGVTVKIKQLSVHLDLTDSIGIPGTLSWDKRSHHLCVHCKRGVVVIEKLTVAGKTFKPVDFYNGYLTKRSKDQWTFS